MTCYINWMLMICPMMARKLCTWTLQEMWVSEYHVMNRERLWLKTYQWRYGVRRLTLFWNTRTSRKSTWNHQGHLKSCVNWVLLVFKIGKYVRSPKSGQTCWLLEQAVPGRDENLLPRVVSIVKTKQRKPFFNFYSPLWKPEKSALFCHEMPDIFRICLQYKVNQLSLVIFISQKSWKKKFLEFFQLCLFL